MRTWNKRSRGSLAQRAQLSICYFLYMFINIVKKKVFQQLMLIVKLQTESHHQYYNFVAVLKQVVQLPGILSNNNSKPIYNTYFP